MANIQQKEVAEEVVRRYFKSRLTFTELSSEFWVSGKPGDILEFLQSYGACLERVGEDNVEDFVLESFGDLRWKIKALVTF
ncbi:hypothetical protein PP940_gp072 [Rhizobium phage RL2RES]|uniref:Uncharacterized protein n=1 Tax=Rhizobium phage RL2RES TaxID=103371 RepID=A0A6B9J7T7_9CAUD|nr:hypothetical protein PP940_gp072 [Rhizobium phage RL2RES]QGZ14301.1 hypothetical protein RL2RES_072 [Rhizobium phage RL2RES]